VVAWAVISLRSVVEDIPKGIRLPLPGCVVAFAAPLHGSFHDMTIVTTYDQQYLIMPLSNQIHHKTLKYYGRLTLFVIFLPQLLEVLRGK
jgi:hypothetical protein